MVSRIYCCGDLHLELFLKLVLKFCIHKLQGLFKFQAFINFVWLCPMIFQFSSVLLMFIGKCYTHYSVVAVGRFF